MGAVVFDVAAAYIVEAEFQVVVGCVAVLCDDVLVIVSVGGNTSEVVGVGDTDHQPAFSAGEIGFDPGMGEGAVGEEIGHAVVVIRGGIRGFITKMGGPGAGGDLQPVL